MMLSSCSALWNLQAEACTFRVSSSWPNAGLETGRGFIFFPFLFSSGGGVFAPASDAAASAQRLNVTCPLSDWAALEAVAPGGLAPCAAATVTTGEQLLEALTSLQVRATRVLITLAANISLPAAAATALPPPAAAVDGAADGNAKATADPAPLVVIYRNTTLVGLGSPTLIAGAGAGNGTGSGGAGSGGGAGTGGYQPQQQPTELNLLSRRNSFLLQQPAAAGSGGGGDGVVVTFADMALVNIPVGPRETWPAGLISTGMWHMGMDRSDGAPVQLIHLRIALVLSLGQTRYFSYWYSLMTSVIAEEKARAAWLAKLITPTEPMTFPGETGKTQFGLTGTFLKKYNTSATSGTVLTGPAAPPVDMWSVYDSPVAPADVGFATSQAELHRELNGPWTGPRVVVLLNDISLDESVWPKDGIQLAAAMTISGPFPSIPSSPSSASASSSPSALPAPTVTLDMRALQLARPPPDQAVTFRNLRVFNASVSIAWALVGAPASLPGVPAYEPWRAKCLPGPMAESGARLAMSGCEIDVPADVFTLLQIYNNLPCNPDGTTASSKNCTSKAASAAAAAARFPYLPSQLGSFFDSVFRATGKYALMQPDAETILLRDNTLTAFDMEMTVFRIILEPSPLLATPPSSSGGSASASNSSAADAAVATVRGASAAAPSSCSLQSLLTILMSAPSYPATTTSYSSGSIPTQGSSSSRRAVVGGVAAGSAVAGVIALAAAVLIVRRLRQPRRRTLKECEVDAERAAKSEVLLPLGVGSVDGGGTGGCGAAVLKGRRAKSNATSVTTGAGAAGGDGGGGSSGATARHGTGCPGAATGCRTAATVRHDGTEDRCAAAAVGCAPPPPPPAADAGPGRGPGAVSDMEAGGAAAGSDAEGCSAFSRSFAVGELVAGKAPTMLEQLLGPPRPHQVGPGVDGTMAQAVFADGGAAAVDGGALAAAAAVAAAGPSSNGRGGDDPPNPNNNNNGGPNIDGNVVAVGGGGLNGGGGTSSRGPTPGGGPRGEHVQQALAGEIDGMIRRFEATATAQQQQQQQHQSGQHSGQGVTNRQRVLGSGGFGVVYKGEWRGLPVAIKVVLLQDGDSAARRERLVREVALSATLSHPNVVPTYHYTVQPVAAAGMGPSSSLGFAGARPRATVRPSPRAAGAPEAGALAASGGELDGGIMAYKLSIFMAYCDRGTLRDALREGVFARAWPPAAMSPPPLAQQQQQPKEQQQQADGQAAVAAQGQVPQPEGAPKTASDGGGISGLTEQQRLPGPLPLPPGADEVEVQTAAAVVADGVADVPLTAAEAVVAVEAEVAESPRPLRLPTGGCGGKAEGRLEMWRDLQAAPNQALALFAALDVARGLDYLHSCNVVHGDLSLQNILLTSTEPFFPDAILSAAGAAAASGSNGSSMAAAGGATGVTASPTIPAVLAAAPPPSRGSHLSAMEMLPEEVHVGGDGQETSSEEERAAAAAVAAGRLRLVGTAVPCCSLSGSEAAERPSLGATTGVAPSAAAPAVPPASICALSPRPLLKVRAALAPARLVYGGPGGGASSGASGTADAALTEETEPLAATASTVQSGTLGQFSLSAEDAAAAAAAAAAATTTTASAASTGGGVISVRRQLTSSSRRLALVQPLLGQVFKISDFGLSVRLEGDETHRSGLHQGTPYYTATEVLLSGKVSPAADIYSFGVCLWCLAHGVALCQLRHLLPHMFTPVAPTLLAHLAPDLHPGLRSLVRRCLEGDPARRPTAAALVSELHALVQAVCGPELAQLLLGAERQERGAGRTVAGSLMMDSGGALGGHALT